MSAGLIVFLTVLCTLLLILMGFNIFIIVRGLGIMRANMEIIDQSNQFLADFMAQQREAMEMDDDDIEERKVSL